MPGLACLRLVSGSYWFILMHFLKITGGSDDSLCLGVPQQAEWHHFQSPFLSLNSCRDRIMSQQEPQLSLLARAQVKITSSPAEGRVNSCADKEKGPEIKLASPRPEFLICTLRVDKKRAPKVIRGWLHVVLELRWQREAWEGVLDNWQLDNTFIF